MYKVYRLVYPLLLLNPPTAYTQRALPGPRFFLQWRRWRIKFSLGSLPKLLLLFRKRLKREKQELSQPKEPLEDISSRRGSIVDGPSFPKPGSGTYILLSRLSELSSINPSLLDTIQQFEYIKNFVRSSDLWDDVKSECFTKLLKSLWPSVALVLTDLLFYHLTSQVAPVSPGFQKSTALGH